MSLPCPLTSSTTSDHCRNTAAATHLKLISIIIILVSSTIGITFPVLLSRLFQTHPTYTRTLLLIKCFAAGVILSTSLVHVLPDAFSALADCHVASLHPWRDFPFSGFVTLIGVLLALLVDVTATSHASHAHANPKPDYKPLGLGEMEKMEYKRIELREVATCQGGEEEEERVVKEKQRLVSQVLEIGIIFHSVIIGVTMGMSQNQCTIRPLVAALAFHQIFEGLGLGGCIAQAGFSMTTVGYMSFMFSVTTPIGIALGMMIFYMTGYDDSSPNALILEGLLGSLSAGILVYMALVDLIAVDFFHNKMMSSNTKLKKVSYLVLVLGSASMSLLALWA